MVRCEYAHSNLIDLYCWQERLIRPPAVVCISSSLQHETLSLAGEQQLETRSKEQNTDIEVTEASTQGSTIANSYSMQEDKSIFPLDNQVPFQILDREYLVRNERMGAFSSFSIEPFETLYSETELSNFLESWRYFRYDVQVRVQIVSPITTFGYLRVHFEPWSTLRPNYLNDDFVEFAVLNGATLAVADSEGLVMDIPWTGPFHMADGAESGKLLSALRQGTFKIATNPGGLQRLDDEDVDILVQVFLKAKNPSVQGPVILGRAAGLAVTKQSLVNPGQRHVATMERAGTMLASGAVGTLFYNQVASFGSYVAGRTYSNVMTKVGNAAAEKVTNHVTGKKVSKTQQHVEDNERTAVRQQVFGDMAALASPTSFQNLAEDANEFPLPDGYTGSSSESANLYKLIRRWAPLLEREVQPILPDVLMLNNYINIINFRACPFKVDMGPLFQPAGDDGMYYAGYMDWFSRFFRYWRGSLEYKIKVFTPPVATFKFLIGIYWGPIPTQTGNNAVLPTEATGPVQTMTFDARGTTEFSFVVPFLRNRPWDAVGSLDEVPYVQIRVLSGQPTGLDAQWSVPFLMFWRAGDDFMYRSLCSPQSVGSTPTALKSPVVKHGFVNDPQDTEINVSWGATEDAFSPMAYHGSIADMIRRPSSRNTTFGQPWYDQPGATFNGLVSATSWQAAFGSADILDIMSNIYTFQSGSYRIKASFSYENANDMVYIQLPFSKQAEAGFNGANVSTQFSYRNGNGSQVIQSAIWPVAEFEVPFLSQYAMSGNLDSEFPEKRLIPTVNDVIPSQTPIPQNGRLFISPGDDFAFHILQPPPTKLLPLIVAYLQ